MRTHVMRLPEFYDSAARQAAGKRILVVDDEVKIRELYVHILSSAGFDVVTAGNAMDAHNVLKRKKFDLVLLDINMEEVDGPTLFDVIRLFHKDVKIIVASVHSVDQQKRRIMDADGYFDKSDDKEVLLSLVYGFLLRTRVS